MYKELDSVVLLTDMPAHGLRKGDAERGPEPPSGSSGSGRLIRYAPTRDMLRGVA